MRLATVRGASRDGSLVVVDRAARRSLAAAGIVGTLQGALDDWDRVAPALKALSERLERDPALGAPLDLATLTAPLPRAFEWVDGSSYLNHVRLVRRARNSDPPDDLESEPLVYQGGSGVLLGACDPLKLTEPAWGLDFEAEICAVLGDVSIGTTADRAAGSIRLLMLANDVTYRNLVPQELKKGFGFFQSKPATAFSPFAVTPDELGRAFHGGRVHLRLRSSYNGEVMGEVDAGPEMHFSFFDLIEHISETRAFAAGTILGSGTVSNEAAERGVSCLVERRARETIQLGAPKTAYMKAGDRVRIEMLDANDWSIFGAIDQLVTS